MPFNKLQFKVILIANIIWIVNSESYRECIGDDKHQKFIVSYDNCAKYIYCDGDNSFEGECLGDYYFNLNEGKCDERTAVKCQKGDEQIEVTRKPDSQISTGSVLALDGGRVDENFFITDSIKINNNKNTINNKINNTNNQNSNSNNIWNNIIAQQQVKQQPSQLTGIGDVITGLAQNAIDFGNTGANVANFAQPPLCPISYGLHNIIYLPNTKSCSSYYTCYNGIAIPMICPRHTYFNEVTSRCERQDSHYCPYDRPVRLVCNPGVYDYIPHSRNCGYYYYCSNGYLMILQCPLQFMWHYERRSCVHHSQAKCFSSAVAQAMLT